MKPVAASLVNFALAFLYILSQKAISQSEIAQSFF